MYLFSCLVNNVYLTSRNSSISPHQNSYIEFHIKLITYIYRQWALQNPLNAVDLNECTYKLVKIMPYIPLWGSLHALNSAVIYTVVHFAFCISARTFKTYYHESTFNLRRKKSCLFPLTRPTLIFHADPKVLFSSISEKNPN